MIGKINVHSIAVHGLTHQDIVVVVVGKDLLDGSGSTGLELIDGLLGGTSLGQSGKDLLHVGCRKEDWLALKCDVKAKWIEMQRRTLEVTLEGILGGLHALLGLEPVETELVLNVVDHDGLTLTTGILITALSGGVGTLELEVLVLLLEVLAAVAGPEELALGVLLDLVGVGENLVAGDDIL